MSNPELVMASGSPYRRQLLDRLGLVDVPQADERPLAGEDPAALVTRLAQLKARTVAARRPGTIVIGSDQVAVRDREVLGKPGTANRIRRALALKEQE